MQSAISVMSGEAKVTGNAQQTWTQMKLPNGPLYSCQGYDNCSAGNQAYPPSELEWYATLQLWLCRFCEAVEFTEQGLEDDWPEEHYEATIRLDEYLEQVR